MSRVAVAALVLVLGSALVPACGCGQTYTRAYAPPTAAAIGEALAERRQVARSFNHASKMVFVVDGERLKTGVYVMGEVGSKIRLQALDPAGGTTVADLACDGSQFAFVDHQHDCQLAGPCTDESIAALLKVRLSPDDFVLLALGQPPALPGGEVASVTWDTETGREIVLVRAPDGRSQRLALDGRSGPRWDLVEGWGYHADGKLDWHLQQKDLGDLRAADGATLRAGGKLKFEQPATDAVLEVAWEDRALNPTLPPEKFTIAVPPGLRQCGAKR